MVCGSYLNLIVKDRLSMIESHIAHVRDNVSSWNSSPKQLEKFELVAR